MTNFSHLARQALHRDGLAALPIARYQLCHHIDDEAMMNLLGCTLEDLNRLRLCEIPQTDEERERIGLSV